MTQQKCHWQGSVQNRKLQPTSTLSQGTHWCLNRETSLTCTMLLIANRQQVISQLPTDLNPYKKKNHKNIVKLTVGKFHRIQAVISQSYTICDWEKCVRTFYFTQRSKIGLQNLSLENCLLKRMEYGFCFFFSSYEYNLYTCFSTLNMHNLRKVGWFWNVGGLRLKSDE